ncbi:MAG: tol-pal system protein YbgF, partial [Rhodoblastus sp.]|nr:tol-pal system protein YbgF [Rhodoblastus sp.]
GRDPGEAPNPMKPLDLGGPRPTPPAEQPGATGTQVAATPPMGIKEEYEQAAALLKQGQYDGAQKGFEGFVAKHARSRYTPDAVFGLGETFFQRGRHREAAEQYLKISTNFANSSRGPEAMLRLGQSLNALGAKEQACASFAEVGRKYPGASNTIRAAERESKKISC